MSRLLVQLGLLLVGFPGQAGSDSNDSPRALQRSQTRLGIAGSRFTVNGKPAFLLGISYYGGLGAPTEFIQKDLKKLREHGFNWLRVWATWGQGENQVSAVGSQGNGREPFLGRLMWLVAECDRMGFIVDVTLTRGKASASGNGAIPNLAAHRRTISTVISTLKPYTNWYLDLANEHDVEDDRFVPADELRDLREQARSLAPHLLVTTSFGGHMLNREDVRQALEVIGADFLCPHLPREPGAPERTEALTRTCLGLIKDLGHTAPVHYQEPFRRGYGRWEPRAEDFMNDLRGAIAGGAAGWCFHNGQENRDNGNRVLRSFDLRKQPLFEQLDADEQKVVAGVAATVDSASR